MLEVLKKREVYLTLAVVTRYFGGVKLGANGLIGAYTESVCHALENADLRKFVYSTVQKAEVSYSIAPKIAQMINDFGGRVISTEYDSNVCIEYSVEEGKSQELSDKMIDFCSGKINIEFIKKDFVDYV